jgi:hypothetical protein
MRLELISKITSASPAGEARKNSFLSAPVMVPPAGGLTQLPSKRLNVLRDSGDACSNHRSGRTRQQRASA